MAEKKCVHLTIDADVYEEAKIKYSNFSGRVNELVKADLELSDEEDVLIKEFNDARAQYHAAKTKLCKYREDKKAKSLKDDVIDEVFDWAMDIHERKNEIGENMLRKECKRKSVSFEAVKELLEKEDVVFVKFGGS